MENPRVHLLRHLRLPLYPTHVLCSIHGVQAYALPFLVGYIDQRTDVSIEASDPRYHKFAGWLSPGWVPGRKIVSATNLLGPLFAMYLLFAK